MKAVAVSDAFVTEQDYRNAFAGYAGIELGMIPFFGVHDRQSMRDVIHTIERGGPGAVEPPEELYELIADAEILMVHLCPVPRKLLEEAPKLRYILTNRGGIENIDVQAATELGIEVLSNPAHNANAVAEYTVALMLSESRNITRADRSLREGIWREKFPNSGQIFEISGATVGLIGFGTIARLVARKLSMFSCDILVYDAFVPQDDPEAARYGCRFVSMEELLKKSDIVSLHARSETVILGKEQLTLMKPGAYLVNTARPHLIDNAYLWQMLHDGKLMGAALDVFMNEPLSREEPFLKLDNVTLSNHRGGDTANAYSDSPKMLLMELQKLMEGGTPRFWVNRHKMVCT